MNSRPTIRVLLIDDDEDEFVLIRDILAEIKTTQFQLEWTKNIEHARAQILAHSHDVYLLDYRLGEWSGVDLLKSVFDEGTRAPIILLTGYDDENVDREALNLGAADYLQKAHLTSQLLERTMRYAIYRSQMQVQAISNDRMASIGLLASSLAHEIGTPLAVIRGRAEYLAMQVNNNPAIKNNVDIITTQIDRVSGLIRSLLNLARGDSSELLSSTNVNAAMNDVLQLVAHEIKKENINIANAFENAEPIFIRGQSEKLQQVLLNLVVNSIFAIRKAKETCVLQDNYVINCKWSVSGNQLQITVEDNGCGISKENLSEIFRPFFSTKLNSEGTGLGLATSLWIIESWSGNIAAESQEGAGAKFTITLPKMQNL